MNIVEYNVIDRYLKKRIQILLNNDTNFGFMIPNKLENSKIISIQNNVGQFLGFAYVVLNKNSLEISTLYISKEYRGKGLGSILLNYIDMKYLQYYKTCLPMEGNGLKEMLSKYGWKTNSNTSSLFKLAS